MPYVNIAEDDSVGFQGLPNKCPFCHLAISPEPIFAMRNSFTQNLEVFFGCPSTKCRRSFIGYYESDSYYGYRYLGKTIKGNIEVQDFSDHINSISSLFVTIYNEAYFAEQHNLFEICGVGYRKALEFLIKDYCIKKHPDQEELIKSKMLGPVIQEFVNDERIKTVAKRAVWLGNDETHYVRKWENKTLEDMKKLIALTVHWIEMEELTNSFSEDMPG